MLGVAVTHRSLSLSFAGLRPRSVGERLIRLDCELEPRVLERVAPTFCDLRLELPAKRGVDLTGVEVP